MSGKQEMPDDDRFPLPQWLELTLRVVVLAGKAASIVCRLIHH